MPEGPECTLHAEFLDAACRGMQIRRASIMSGRYLGDGATPGRGAPPDQWDQLQSALPASITAVRSKGKFIYWTLRSTAEDHLTLWSTLGMTGAWALAPSEHARICLELVDDGAAAADGPPSDGQAALRLWYNDQRNFGTVTVCVDEAKLEAKLASLGPSWLPPGGLGLDAFREIIQRQCKGKRGAAVPVAKFLMDQSKTAGIGNYILSETLFLARIWPWARCGDLSDEEWTAVHEAASDVIERSYRSQRALAEANAAEAVAARGAGTRSLSATRGTTFTFELHVFRRTQTASGMAVRHSEGPHKRSIFWVEELQTRGRVEDAA